MNHREHFFLAKELVVVLFGLGIESRIVIGVEALRSGRRAVERLVQASYAAAARIPRPRVVTLLGRRIAISNQALSARFLRREQWIQSEQPEAAGLLEVGIDRQRLYFGAAHQIVARVVADLDIVDDLLLFTRIDVLDLAIEKTQIVIVGADRAEHVVPHDLVGDLRVVGVDQREGLTRDVANQRAMVVGQAHLRGVFLGRVLKGRRPIDSLGGHDIHLHSVRHHVVDAGRHQVFDLRRVLRSDYVSGLNSGPGGGGEQSDAHHERADTRYFPCDAGTTRKHSLGNLLATAKGRPDRIRTNTSSHLFPGYNGKDYFVFTTGQSTLVRLIHQSFMTNELSI